MAQAMALVARGWPLPTFLAQTTHCFHVHALMRPAHARRYIYLWIKYALFEELDVGDVQRARDVYRAALELVPHKSFTFAKVGKEEYSDGQAGSLQVAQEEVGKGKRRFPLLPLFAPLVPPLPPSRTACLVFVVLVLSCGLGTGSPQAGSSSVHAHPPACAGCQCPCPCHLCCPAHHHT